RRRWRRSAPQSVALGARPGRAAVPPLGVHRYRPGVAPDLGDDRGRPSRSAPTSLSDRRNRGNARGGGALPGLRPPVAVHAAPDLPAGVAGHTARASAVHDGGALVGRNLRGPLHPLLQRETRVVPRVSGPAAADVWPARADRLPSP